MVNLPNESLIGSAPEINGVLLFLCNDFPVHSLSPSVELQDLEEVALVAGFFSFIRQYSTDPFDPYIRQNAMNKLRNLFNMEFKMRCDKCDKLHYQDEISAPER